MCRWVRCRRGCRATSRRFSRRRRCSTTRAARRVAQPSSAAATSTPIVPAEFAKTDRAAVIGGKAKTSGSTRAGRTRMAGRVDRFVAESISPPAPSVGDARQADGRGQAARQDRQQIEDGQRSNFVTTGAAGGVDRREPDAHPEGEGAASGGHRPASGGSRCVLFVASQESEPGGRRMSRMPVCGPPLR